MQIEKAGRELLARLARESPLLPAADVLAFVDVDSTQKRVYGRKKEARGSAAPRSRASPCCSGA